MYATPLPVQCGPLFAYNRVNVVDFLVPDKAYPDPARQEGFDFHFADGMRARIVTRVNSRDLDAVVVSLFHAAQHIHEGVKHTVKPHPLAGLQDLSLIALGYGDRAVRDVLAQGTYDPVIVVDGEERHPLAEENAALLRTLEAYRSARRAGTVVVGMLPFQQQRERKVS